jgi:O-acetylserine/cysteine efflux transporter
MVMARTRSANLPVLGLVCAAGLWGVATSATKVALDAFDPVTLLVVELVAATVALWIVLLVRGYRRPASWRLAATLGALEPALAYLANTVGLLHTSAANGAAIGGLESAFVVVLAALFLREPLTRALVGSLLVAILGLGVLEGPSAVTHPRVGDLLVLGGALSAAVYTIFARRLSPGEDPLVLTAHQFAFATAAVLPLAVPLWCRGSESLPSAVAPRFWLVAIAIGVAGYGLSFLLYNHSIAQIQAGPAGLIINLIPAFGLASAVLWLGDAVTVERLLGTALITASVGVVTWTEIAHPTLAA